MSGDELGLSDDAISADTHVVGVAGELDAHTCEQLEALVDQVIGHGATHLVIDLEGVTYLDSAGLGVLLHCARRLRRPEGAMAVVARAHAQPRERIDLTGTRDVLHVCADRDEALAVIEGRGPEPGTTEDALRLRLYVDTSSRGAHRAVDELERLRATRLPPGTEIEVIDARGHPERADRDHVIATPALIRLAPPPLVRVIGDLSDHDQVLAALLR